MIPLSLFLEISIVASIAMAVLWYIQYQTSDAGIVDVGWALGMAGAILTLGHFSEGDLTRRILVTACVTIWAGRLGVYLLFNRVLGKEHKEDGRYTRMRESMNDHAQIGFFVFFQVQALFIILFTIPLYIALSNPTEGLTSFDIMGLLIWVGAIIGEGVADKQLAAFRANPMNRGTTCQVGLWRYSRHPNYFFEWIHWLAYPFFSVGSPYLFIVCLAPMLMLIFLIKVTGIPYTEQQALSHREDYADYQKSTPMFFPWFPKK